MGSAESWLGTEESTEKGRCPIAQDGSRYNAAHLPKVEHFGPQTGGYTVGLAEVVGSGEGWASHKSC